MPNHGGARPGAGRHTVKYKAHQVLVYLRMDQIAFLAGKGNHSEYIRSLLDAEMLKQKQAEWNNNRIRREG